MHLYKGTHPKQYPTLGTLGNSACLARFIKKYVYIKI